MGNWRQRSIETRQDQEGHHCPQVSLQVNIMSNYGCLRRKAVAIATCGPCYAYVTENGKVYLGGRHAMRTHPESGLVLGLDGVSIVTVALGKTHAAAVSKHGHLYTWGLNNLNQCGRIEVLFNEDSEYILILSFRLQLHLQGSLLRERLRWLPVTLLNISLLR